MSQMRYDSKTKDFLDETRNSLREIAGELRRGHHRKALASVESLLAVYVIPDAGSEQPIFCGPGCAQFHDQPCSEQPDLPLGHEHWNPGFPNMDGSSTKYPSACCKLCGRPESAHRRKGK